MEDDTVLDILPVDVNRRDVTLTSTLEAVPALIENAGKQAGMQLIDDSIQAHLDSGRITGETAYMAALDKERFANFAPTKPA